jgi:hypothetical protein
MGAGRCLEALLARGANRGAGGGGRIRWRIDISSKIARRPAAGVQLFHLRQRWGAAIWREQTQVLLGRLKYAALPGWEEAERVQTRSEHSSGGQLQDARHSGSGGHWCVVEGSTQTAGGGGHSWAGTAAVVGVWAPCACGAREGWAAFGGGGRPGR